jgi:hypothetical protein
MLQFHLGKLSMDVTASLTKMRVGRETAAATAAIAVSMASKPV